MQNPWFEKAIIAASGSVYSPNDVPLVRARTLSLTGKVTYGASINADTTVYVYYSPDGRNWDTEAYTSFALAYSAGNTVQRTVVVDVPEHGYIRTKLTNGSSADTVTDVVVWYSIQSWGDGQVQEHGSILKDAGEGE